MHRFVYLRWVYQLVGLLVGLAGCLLAAPSLSRRRSRFAHHGLRHDERGLSQSTENAILLAGAVTIALAVTTAILAYVKAHLPK